MLKKFVFLLFPTIALGSDPAVIYINPNFSSATSLKPAKINAIVFYDASGVVQMIMSTDPSPAPVPPPPPVPPVSNNPFIPIIKSATIDKSTLSLLRLNYQAVIDAIEHTQIDNQIDAQQKLIELNRALATTAPAISPLLDSMLKEASKRKYYTLQQLHDLYAQIRDALNEAIK